MRVRGLRCIDVKSQVYSCNKEVINGKVEVVQLFGVSICVKHCHALISG